jgi:hypothetical protein
VLAVQLADSRVASCAVERRQVTGRLPLSIPRNRLPPFFIPFQQATLHTSRLALIPLFGSGPSWDNFVCKKI